MANTLYPLFKQALLTPGLDLSGTNVGVMLVNSGYTYSAAHQYVSDATPGTNELTGTGYSRKTLASKTFTNGVFDAADLTWTAINAGTAKAALIYLEGASDAARRLIAYIDTATGVTFPVTTNGGDYNLNWDNGASKIFAL